MSTESQSPAPEPGPGADAEAAPEPAPQFTRATLALTSSATLAVAPVAAMAFGPAGSGASAHTSPVYVLAQAAHDIGHNDWAFQGGPSGRVGWIATYAALAFGWLVVALWMWAAGRRAGHRAPWLRSLIAAWSAIGLSGALTLGIAYYVESASVSLGPLALRFSDLCSPWWSGPAVLAGPDHQGEQRSEKRSASGPRETDALST